MLKWARCSGWDEAVVIILVITGLMVQDFIPVPGTEFLVGTAVGTVCYVADRVHVLTDFLIFLLSFFFIFREIGDVAKHEF